VKTVLVVEDDDKSRKLLVDVLSSGGYSVVHTDRGEAAADLARMHRPDVALLDIHLPGIDGFETLARLQAEPVCAGLRTIAITASVMPRDTARILGEGFDKLVPKPFDLPNLLNLVAELASD